MNGSARDRQPSRDSASVDFPGHVPVTLAKAVAPARLITERTTAKTTPRIADETTIFVQLLSRSSTAGGVSSPVNRRQEPLHARTATVVAIMPATKPKGL